jgi:hypothetical protein
LPAKCRKLLFGNKNLIDEGRRLCQRANVRIAVEQFQTALPIRLRHGRQIGLEPHEHDFTSFPSTTDIL